jgi:hypothetical protein
MIIIIKLQVFGLEIVFVGIPLMGFCSLRLYQILSQHISIVSVRLNKTPEQINEEKSILKMIVIRTDTCDLLPAGFFLLYHGRIARLGHFDF